MSQRILITTALAFGAGVTAASVPQWVPGGDQPEAVEHREVRRTVRRVRRSHDPDEHRPTHDAGEYEAEGDRRTRRSRRDRRDHRDHHRDRGHHSAPPTQTVSLDRDEISYEVLGRAGRALAHRGEDGEQDGYRLSAVRPDSITADLGLRNGDIVTHVGGIPLTSMDRAIEAWQAAQHASEVTLQLIRAGRTERIIVQLG